MLAILCIFLYAVLTHTTQNPKQIAEAFKVSLISTLNAQADVTKEQFELYVKAKNLAIEQNDPTIEATAYAKLSNYVHNVQYSDIKDAEQKIDEIIKEKF